MSVFRTQLEAIGSALLLVQKLPSHAIWSLMITNDDDAEAPSVLNIFATSDEWLGLVASLRLGKHVDQSTGEKGEQFLSFRQGTLLISFIEQEEK